MKKKIVITTIIVLVLTAIIIVYSIASGRKHEAILEAMVQKGDFEIIVSVTGELQAERSEQIMAPSELRSRNLRFGDIQIQDLVAEGSVVDSGEYVGQLNRSDADNRLKDLLDELEQKESAYLRLKLDTTITLRNLRDELIDLRFAREEAEITLEQSKFEPPATIRQAQINLDKTKRQYDQARRNYTLKVQTAIADMRESEIELAKARRTVDEMQNVLEKFTIRAPGSGMVVYYKEWSGSKRKVGSSISPWDLTVATLPDLSSFISKTYVNEIDISKVKVGQEVRIGVDAFPDKSYSGVVTEVANVGEQLQNTDAKVYEVVIKLNGSDPVLRPAMTTSNQIVTAVYRDTLFIPLEAIQVTDSIPYVIKKSGLKQIVVLGDANENEIIVEKGLEEGDRIYLSIPEGLEHMKMAGQELIPLIREKARQKRLEEERRNGEMVGGRRGMRGFTMPEGVTPQQMEQMMQEGGGRRVMRVGSDTSRAVRFRRPASGQQQEERAPGTQGAVRQAADTGKTVQK